MSQNDENSESPPQIYKETEKILQYKDEIEEKNLETKRRLEYEESFSEKLFQYQSDLNKSIAEEEAALSVANSFSSFIDNTRTELKEPLNQWSETYKTCCDTVNKLDSDWLIINDKFTYAETTIGTKMTNYKKKLEDLNRVLTRLTNKRKAKLPAIEDEENDLEKESIELRKQLKEADEELLKVDEGEDESDPEELQKELDELHSKLSELTEDFSRLAEEDELCRSANDELETNYGEAVFTDINTSLQIDAEIELLRRDEEQVNSDMEKDSSLYQTLEECERKLNEELSHTSKFYEDLINRYEGDISKFESKIAIIRADIAERSKKYDLLQHEVSKSAELLSRQNEECKTRSEEIEQLSADLQEVNKTIESLETSENLDLCENRFSVEVDELQKEKHFLEDAAKVKESDLQAVTKRIESERFNRDLEIVAFENQCLMREKELEKANDEAKSNKDKIETRIKSAEETVQELEASKNISSNLERLRTEALEMRNKIGNVKKAPAPIFAKKAEMEKSGFVRPKTPTLSAHQSARTLMKKTHSPKRERNWNSDSSQEGEALTLNELMRRKQSRRSFERKGK